MTEICRNLDEVLEVAAAVADGSMSPLVAARLMVGRHIETDQGMQPQVLLIPSAVTMGGRDPSLLVTALSRDGTRAWKVMTDERGGAVPVVRASGLAEVGIWALSDPNGAGSRVRYGGAGVTNANYQQFTLGVGGWRGDTSENHLFEWHEVIGRHVALNPNEQVGVCDVVINDGSFHPMPSAWELPGHFVSNNRSGHETVATFPVLGKAMLGLNPQFVDYPKS